MVRFLNYLLGQVRQPEKLAKCRGCRKARLDLKFYSYNDFDCQNWYQTYRTTGNQKFRLYPPQYIGILIDWLMVSYEHVSDIGGLLTVFGAIQIRNNVNVLFADIAARRVMQKIGKTTNTIAITLRWIVDNINALYHQLTLQKENLKILNSFSQVRNFQRQSRPAAAVAKLIDKKVVITKYFVKNTW